MEIRTIKDGELAALLATSARITIQCNGEEFFDLLFALNTVGTLLENPAALLATLDADRSRGAQRDALYNRLIEVMRAANKAVREDDHEA